MNFNHLNDETLVLLHQKKKADVLFILYNRHNKKCGAIIYRALSTSPHLKMLIEDSTLLIVESLKKAIDTFDASKGKAFVSYLGQIVFNAAISRLRNYAKDPMSNYLSLDNSIDYKDEEVKLSDTLAFADSSIAPNERINVNEFIESINEIWCDKKYKRIRKMIKLKEQGYSFEEIAKKMRISEKAVRSTLYRIRKVVQKELNRTIK